MGVMVQISRELDQQTYPSSMRSHNIEYLRRRDGDLQFREMASAGRDLSRFREFPYRDFGCFQTLVRSYREPSPVSTKEEPSKDYKMGLLL